MDEWESGTHEVPSGNSDPNSSDSFSRVVPNVSPNTSRQSENGNNLEASMASLNEQQEPERTEGNHFNVEAIINPEFQLPPHEVRPDDALGYAVAISTGRLSSPFQENVPRIPGEVHRFERTSAPLATGFPKILDSPQYIVYDYCLGGGANGNVLKARVKGFGVCAVKRFVNHNRMFDEREVMNSIKLCHHNHIVSIYALLYADTVDPIASGIVIEYMDGGCMADFLQGPYASQITEKKRISYGEQIANALMFMHGSKYIHRDVKPHNIVLDATFKTAKLCDFGLSRDLDNTMTSRVGTLRYTAPEVLVTHSTRAHYKESADVYSFAMTMFEIYHHEPPFVGLEHSFRTIDSFRIMLLSDMNNRPVITAPMEDDVKSVIIQMGWHNTDAFRPSMIEIVDILMRLHVALDIRDEDLLYRPLNA